jgi:uncharacterized protein with GYD domain
MRTGPFCVVRRSAGGPGSWHFLSLGDQLNDYTLRVGDREDGWRVRLGLRSLDRIGLRSVPVQPSAEGAASHGYWLVIGSPAPADGISMPLYMYQASYTAKSMADQLKEPQDPVELIRPALEELGATIVVAGFPFGEYDVVVVYEAADDMTAASVAMAVTAAGEVRSGKTTRLLSGQEWLESLRKRRTVTNRKRASRTTGSPDRRNS